jgi:translation elongation factor P/translation initiation factor 5A
LKVAQLIPYDAYPGGAGQEIIEFFKGKGLVDYKNNSHSFQILSEKVDNLNFMTDEEFNELKESYSLADNFRYLYSGIDILNWLYNDGYYIYQKTR